MENTQSKGLTFTTKTMAYMAIFAAIQIVLEYCTHFFEMPQGGNVAFSLVSIFLCSYIMGWGYGVIVSMVCLGLHFALGLAVFYGPWSVIFDYVLPMLLVGMSGLIPLVKVGKYDVPIGIVIMCVLKTICHLIAGALAFNTALIPNLVYNIPYNLGTLVACFILFMLLEPRLKKAVKM
ncbi:MAG: energy-coupled thiamine transporter ThiT [Thomasclavelia sp.]|jgi:thiamine transporter|nr:energy-coupled thiamine transporter ThiT [Thomasclavelia sp.]